MNPLKMCHLAGLKAHRLFIEPEDLFYCSQEPATGPYRGLDESS